MGDALINDNGIGLIAGFCGFLGVLLGLNMLFQMNRRQQMKLIEASFGMPLLFHSPDDTPRNFNQYGFKFSIIGAILLNGWVAIFVLGYMWMILFCWFAYAPGFSAPDFAIKGFGGWNGLMAPWLVIFTLIHIIGIVLIIFWEAMRTRFMMPTEFLCEATHVMIEEEVDFDTDQSLVDPDTLPMWKQMQEHADKLKNRFERAKCRTVVPVIVETDGTRRIEYTCVRYIFFPEENCFQPTGLVKYTPMQIHKALKDGGLSSKEAMDTMNMCGKNTIYVHVPSILEALVTEFADFTYIFNSIGTWSYMVFSTWNIGFFWLLLTVFSGSFRSLFIVRPNQKKIHELAQLKTECKVLRDGKWQIIEASEMVLGDIIAVDDNEKLPCDGIVIEGSLVVNESMLTGEPMPIQKMPVEHSEHASVGKKNVAYAGTLCLQSNGPQDGRAVMIATAVGALTARGQLVRMVLFPTSVRFKYTDQLPTVYGILMVWMFFLLCIYVSPLMNLKSWIATYLMVLNTIAMGLNPMLPVSMIMGQSVAAKRLETQHKIGVLQPGRIPIAGKISTMVFDKTGTITKDGMDFDGVLPVDNAEFGNVTQFLPDEDPETIRMNNEIAKTVPGRLRYALGSCHTVTTLKDGTLVGNAVECSMVTIAGWKIGETEVTSPDGKEVLQIVKKLDFDHCRMTSGVVVRNKQENVYDVFIKGSYEKIHAISDPHTVPASYGPRTEKFAKDGYYVLGIAHKSLPGGLTAQDLADMSRDELETGLAVCGLLLFRNEMKKDSPDAIRALKKGSVRSVICTGDNALTGMSIGKACGIVTKPVLLGDLSSDKAFIEWRDPDDDDREVVDIFSKQFEGWQLAVTAGAWKWLFANVDELEKIWLRLVCFARMKPEDKINVVKYLQSHNLVVGMCGDGGNDCGGLRAAHAGMALSDAEASMVSPFATGRDGKSLVTVVDLIREGRACLATNIATFQYFIAYALIVTGIRTIGVCYTNSMMGEYIWLTMDVIIGMIMVWTMTQSTATDELCEYRPTATLLGPRTLASIFFPVVTAITTLLIAHGIKWNSSWYEKIDPVADLHLAPQFWMLRGDNYDSPVDSVTLLLSLSTTAYVNTYGGAFRKNIIWNYGINIIYALFLIGLSIVVLGPSTQFNCIYRINCDNIQSQAARALKPIAFWSAGGVGGCFLGPQVKLWQQEMQPTMPDGEYWLPDTTGNCMPPEGSATTPWTSPEISMFGCEGPNNCYPQSFRGGFYALLVGFVVVNHLFVKFVLQGFVAARLRRQRQKDGVEEEDIFVQPKAPQARSIELEKRARSTTGASCVTGTAGDMRVFRE